MQRGYGSLLIDPKSGLDSSRTQDSIPSYWQCRPAKNVTTKVLFVQDIDCWGFPRKIEEQSGETVEWPSMI